MAAKVLYYKSLETFILNNIESIKLFIQSNPKSFILLSDRDDIYISSIVIFKSNDNYIMRYKYEYIDDQPDKHAECWFNTCIYTYNDIIDILMTILIAAESIHDNSQHNIMRMSITDVMGHGLIHDYSDITI